MIQKGDVVTYRLGRAGRHDVKWGPWKTGPMYVRRREVAFKKNSTRASHKQNAIIELTPADDITASFTIDDYDPAHKVFCCEDYYLEIKDFNEPL